MGVQHPIQFSTQKGFDMDKRLIGIVTLAMSLQACGTASAPGIEVRTVEVPTPVPCVAEEDIPEEPAQVGDSLTGDALTDLGFVAPNNIELRIWGRTLLALIDPACIKV